jgi:hypothetical protein
LHVPTHSYARHMLVAAPSDPRPDSKVQGHSCAGKQLTCIQLRSMARVQFIAF